MNFGGEKTRFDCTQKVYHSLLPNSKSYNNLPHISIVPYHTILHTAFPGSQTLQKSISKLIKTPQKTRFQMPEPLKPRAIVAITIIASLTLFLTIIMIKIVYDAARIRKQQNQIKDVETQAGIELQERPAMGVDRDRNIGAEGAKWQDPMLSGVVLEEEVFVVTCEEDDEDQEDDGVGDMEAHVREVV